MPGPPPKNPAVRQRRNATVTRSKLAAEVSPRVRAPALCKRDEKDDTKSWHPMTVRWWHDVWHSPMADEYLRVDEHSLFRLAVLMDVFWTEPTQALAAEIRLQQQAFGLTPLDRRRLEWSIEQAEEAKDRRDLKRGRRATVVQGSDPRSILNN